jgi:lysosomal Pro-X carboxypeptidase
MRVLSALIRAACVAFAAVLLTCPCCSSRPSSADCAEEWFEQRVDHFSSVRPPGGSYTWQQRVLTNDRHYDRDSGCIFFYTGNEGDVTLYANNTGLMWENAQQFGALLVFAEHRYYGKSWPLANESFSLQHMQYLTSQQALADYALLLHSIKQQRNMTSTPAVAFGGSYGGILSALFRAKYPGAVIGAISASAPLRAFPGQPFWDSSAYYAVITNGAAQAGGACVANVRSVWPLMFEDGQTPEGRLRLAAAFSTCAVLAGPDDVLALALWIRGIFDTLSIGNYPYPSSYLTGGAALLPANPIRVACSYLSASDPGSKSDLYSGMKAAAAVLANATADVACFDVPPNPYSHPDASYDGIWDYQRCTEMMPDSFWFTANGGSDMFWPLLQNSSFAAEHCRSAWGVTLDKATSEWISIANDLPFFSSVTNIVFSSGDLDPWSSAGILVSPAAERGLLSINISHGAHHLDLMFADGSDPPSVVQARQVELDMIQRWVRQARG